MPGEPYTVYNNGKEKFNSLTRMEYFDLMEDLSIEFYQTGTPHPNDISYKINKEKENDY